MNTAAANNHLTSDINKTRIFLEQLSPRRIFTARVYYVIKSTLILPGLFESCIKNLLCLETLRHGTSMKNTISIKNNGADPTISHQFAASQADGKGWEKSHNLFYVVRDNYKENKQIPYRALGIVIFQIIKRLMPLEYKIAAEQLDAKVSKASSLHEKILVGVKGFFTPTLKFYFTKHEIKGLLEGQRRFQKDPRHGAALITSYQIELERMGIQGAIQHGCKREEWTGRLKSAPFQFLVGMIQLVACAALSPLAVVSVPLLAIGQAYKIDRV